MNISDLHIAKSISHYLHNHNELCIEGLGRFSGEEVSFLVDPVAKFIYPANRKLNFAVDNSSTTEDFLLFLEKVCLIHNPKEKLISFTQSLKQDLQANRKLELEGLGFFKLNVMGEVDFEPYRQESYEASTFGLKPVHFAANLLKVKRIEIQKEEEDPEVTQMRESALKELKVLLDQVKVTEHAKAKKKSNLFPVVATVLTAVLLINLGFFLFNGPIEDLSKQVAKTNVMGKTGDVLEKAMAEVIDSAQGDTQNHISNNISGKLEEVDYTVVSEKIGLCYKRDTFNFDSLSYTQVLTIEAVQDSVVAAPVSSDNATVNAVNDEVVESVEPVIGDPEIYHADAAENGIEKGFYIVKGAFKNSKNAANEVVVLRKSGYKSAIWIKPEKYPYHLTAIERSETLNRALDKSEKLMAKGQKVWIFAAF